MRLPKTIKGYMAMFNKIETVFMPTTMKGFDDLPLSLQNKIQDFDCMISNEFGELEADYYDFLNKNPNMTKITKLNPDDELRRIQLERALEVKRQLDLLINRAEVKKSSINNKNETK